MHTLLSTRIPCLVAVSNYTLVKEIKKMAHTIMLLLYLNVPMYGS